MRILGHGKPDHLTCRPAKGTIKRSGKRGSFLGLYAYLWYLVEKLSGTIQLCGLTQATQFLQQLPQLNSANVAHASTEVASTYVRLVVVRVNEHIVPCSSSMGHQWQRIWYLPLNTLSVSVSVCAVVGIKTFQNSSLNSVS